MAQKVYTIEEELIPKIDFSKYSKNKYLLDMGDYEIKIEDDKTYVVRKKPQYPKTYKECCEVLEIGTLSNDVNGYKEELLVRFQELLIARDAYWKIAGEQMGLGKPWEPDWSSCEDKFCITIFKNKQTFDESQYISRILAFPTEEMRDDFKENFDKDLEFCKELL